MFALRSDTVNIGFFGPEPAAPIHEAVALLRERDDFLILCHQKPDGDTVGSAFALREALRQMGKRVQVACSDAFTPRYDFITKGEREPHRDFVPKTYITVDIADPSLLGDKLEHLRANIDLAIDHHPSFTKFAACNVGYPSTAAAGEIVYHILRELGVELTLDIAQALYTALSTDTGCFRYSNTTPSALRMAADLAELGLEQVFSRVELPLCPVLAEMERAGMLVDRKALADFGVMLDERLRSDEAAIYALAGERFNINSTQQLGNILFDKLGLPPVKKTKTGWSTNAEVLEKLKEHGWSRAVFRDLTGTAADNDRRLEQEMEELSQRRAEQERRIAAQAGQREALKRAVDRASVEIDREEGKSRLVETQVAFFLEGWVPEERWDQLRQALSDYPCAWEVRDPEPEEYPQVPVQLKNNWLTRPLNMVTEMYSLPAYGSVDPNPLMAPFFILFYGIMMADMGYGLLMMLASVVVLRRMRPKGTMSHFFGLLGLCGVSTFLMGAVTGGFFGDMIPQVLKILNPESTFVWFWPPLFTPLDDTLMILVGAMALGLIQIVTGMAISFIKKIREGQILDAVWEELTWWIVFAGLALAVLGVTNVVIILGGVMVLVGSGWNAKGFGKVTAVFGSLYNHVTGYFGDILSYSRLMALMLAGSVIAQVFNTLGAIPGNLVIFFIISLAGNALNFALNLLGCYVHDLRLQCLEYFGKFYQDGGKPFRPMAVNTRYVDIKEQ